MTKAKHYFVPISIDDPLKKYKLDQIILANDLGYSKECIDAIASSESEIQIDNFLTDARNGKL